jgi:3-hydroxyisobutyrate dehydrogenase-like beta-hydroxyacid dehydrogenase
MHRPERVGLVGLGLVGKAVASRLMSHGYSVAGHDIDPAACDAAAALGVEVLASPREVGTSANRIILSLPDASAVEDVLWGGGGLAEACSSGSTILDTTTTRPEDTQRHHASLRNRNVRFIDVTLVGSSREIGVGKGVALVGAPEAEADFRPVLETFARRVFFLDRPGQGNRAKLVVNLVLGLNRLVLAEGLGLAQRSGMDPAQILEILRDSAARSAVMDTKGPRMVKGEFDPVARLAQHAKDVGLILDMARSTGARTPMSELHARLLNEALEAGWGSLDNSAVIRLFTE